MKKKLMGLGVLVCLFVSGGAYAEELQPAQEIDNNQTYFTPNVQKQPKDSKQKQGISNHFTFFTINVQINGKLGDIPQTEK